MLLAYLNLPVRKIAELSGCSRIPAKCSQGGHTVCEGIDTVACPAVVGRVNLRCVEFASSSFNRSAQENSLTARTLQKYLRVVGFCCSVPCAQELAIRDEAVILVWGVTGRDLTNLKEHDKKEMLAVVHSRFS